MAAILPILLGLSGAAFATYSYYSSQPVDNPSLDSPDRIEKIPEYDQNPIEKGIILEPKPDLLNTAIKKEIDDILTAVIIDAHDFELEKMQKLYEETNDPELKQKIIDRSNQDISDIESVAKEEAMLIKDIIDDETKKLDEAETEKSIIYKKIVATEESDIPEFEKEFIISQLNQKIKEIEIEINKKIDSIIDKVSNFEKDIQM